ncbi:surface antigen-domain-containing protein [Mycotypha africana]|uniref:surface antigen-domain-containing protein n=1 Tax=Mycotypha africana TaxID=64632 RepID=UPI0023002AF4|nr:surface antigen-domain-containing protein [Mycotypha africana]KAI8969029.1 surface antigen-domain-containing protein [Mycotypha africana]
MEEPKGSAGYEDQNQQQFQQEAARRLMNLLQETAGSKTHVNSVSVLGTKITRPQFLQKATKAVLSSTTYADVINNAQNIAEELQRLDIFDHVQVLLDKASDSDPLALPDSINVVYQVKEKSRVFLRTGTEIGNNEGNMNGSITVRNVFGGAELLEAVAAFGTRNSSAFQFSLSKPTNASPDAKVDINAHRVLCNNTLTSSYEELARGVGMKYKSVSKYGYHELGYDLTWRTIDKVSPNASLSIRKEVGDSLKSSISHTFIRERRDDMLLPANGHYIRLAQEISGLFGIGNAHFFKTELESQFCKQLGGGQLLMDKTESNVLGTHPGFVLSTTFRAGWLGDLSDNPKASTVSDRFLLGGPLSIRGFRNAGVGPRDYKDALGGHMYWATGISAIAPLPTLETKPIRAHLFVNAGTNIPQKSGTASQSTMERLIKSPSIAIGFGMIYRHSIARMELNYCIPLTAAKNDQVKRGLQFGIGLNFL